MQNPIISIAILSHNHESFIERAINGVLSQKCNYSFELLLFDDASSDSTQDIINRFAEKYPEIISKHCYSESLGPIVRAKQIFENCKGKYITWLDGDDYWTYHSKLQIQLDFLEANPQYSGCFHDAIISNTSMKNNTETNLISNQSLHKYRYYSQFNHYEIEFSPYLLLLRNIIPTASLVFRKYDFSEFFEKYNLEIYSFSWAFQLHLISYGNFKFFNRCWSVYRDHNEGLSKKISSEKFTLNNISILKYFKKYAFYKNHINTIHESIAREYECMIRDKDKNNIVFKYMTNYLWQSFLLLFKNGLYYKKQYILQFFIHKK